MPDRIGGLRIPSDYLKSLVFLFVEVGEREPDGTGSAAPVGTAFLVGEPLGDTGKVCPWLVTARHVIDNTNAGERLYFRVRRNDNSIAIMMSPTAGWVRHVGSDTAFVRLSLGFATEHLKWIPMEIVASRSYLSDQAIAVGDDVITLGLDAGHVGETHDLAAARFGHISMMSTGPITFATRGGFPGARIPDAYLVEASSWPGQSGAPVFVKPPTELAAEGDTLRIQEHQPALVDLICGHLTSHQPVHLEGELAKLGAATVTLNRGLAIVTPITALLEAMTTAEHLAWRESEIARLKAEPH